MTPKASPLSGLPDSGTPAANIDEPEKPIGKGYRRATVSRCNAATSGVLAKAVLEQTDELDELGGFAGKEEHAQYVRDVRDVVQKLQIAELVIEKTHLKSVYVGHLRAARHDSGR